MGTTEVEPDLLRLFFGRDLCEHDRWAIKNFGMPKYCCHTLLEVDIDANVKGHQFLVVRMFWSDLLHSWVYYVPEYDFYQCESDLEVI